MKRGLWPTAFARQVGGGGGGGGGGTQGGGRRVGALWEGSLTVHVPLRKAQGDAGEGI